MRFNCVSIACGAVSLLIALAARADHPPGGAGYVWTDHVVDEITHGAYIVGYANGLDFHNRANGFGATLTLTENAVVHSAAAFSTSVINTEGLFPTPTGGLGAREDGTANMTGGFAYFLFADENGAINMTGGRTNYAGFNGSSTGTFGAAVIGDTRFPIGAGGTFLEARNDSSLTLNGTQVLEQLRALQSGRISAVGATVGLDVTATNSSRIDLIAGTLGRDLISSGEAAITGLGGNIARDVAADGGSIALEGASVGRDVWGRGGSITLNNVSIVGDLLATGSGPVKVTGGVVVGDVTKGQFGDLTMSGGEVDGNITANSTFSTVALDGVTVGADVSVLNGSINGSQIGGNLANAGTSIPGRFNTLHVSGSTIEGDMVASGGGAIKLSSGEVGGNAEAGGSGTIEMSGGTIGGDFNNNNFATISGGMVTGDLNINVGFVDMSGGSIGQNANIASGASLVLRGSGIVGGMAEIGANGSLTMSGGAVQKDVNLGNKARALLLLGNITGSVKATAEGEVELSGATITGDLSITGPRTFGKMTGGLVSRNVLIDGDQSTTSLTMEGGEVLGMVEVGGTLTLTDGSIAQQVNTRIGIINIGGGSVGGQVLVDEFSRLFVSGGTTSDVKVVDGHGGVTGRVELSGGSIGGTLRGRGGSTIEISGGKVEELNAEGAIVVRMSAGEIAKLLTAIENSRFQMVGGSIGDGIALNGRATVDLFGGLVGGGEGLGLFATDLGRVNVNGTEIRGGAEADQGAELRLNSGRIVGNLKLSGVAEAQLGSGFEITEDLQAMEKSIVKIEGGRIGRNVLASGEETRVTISDGSVGGLVDAIDRSRVTISGGTVEFGLSVSDNTQALITGGTVQATLFASGKAVVVMTGGEIPIHGFQSQVTAIGTSHMFIGGGTIDPDVEAKESSTITISGGIVGGGGVLRRDVQARDNGQVIVTGGEIRDNLEAHEFGKVLLSGGIVREALFGDGNSVVTMSGGLVQSVAVFRGNSTFNYTGGTIVGGIIDQTSSGPSAAGIGASDLGIGMGGGEDLTSAIFMHDNSTLDIIGTDLAAVLIDSNYQDMFSLYQLSGTLADGTPAGGQYFSIQNATGASFRLLPVPEPGGALLLLCAAAVRLLFSRRRRNA